jgi:hypothetical protein
MGAGNWDNFQVGSGAEKSFPKNFEAYKNPYRGRASRRAISAKALAPASSPGGLSKDLEPSGSLWAKRPWPKRAALAISVRFGLAREPDYERLSLFPRILGNNRLIRLIETDN